MVLTPNVAQARQEIARQVPLRRSVIVPVTALTTTAATILTAGTDDIEIGSLSLANLTASPVTATLHVVPDGDVAGDANAIAKARSIAANDTVALVTRDAPLRLAPGETLQALASAGTSLNIFGNGYEIGGEG